MRAPKVVTIYDLEDLHYMAETVIVDLRYRLYDYDEEGNWVWDSYESMTEEERYALREANMERWAREMKTSYLQFRYNEELRKISFVEALEMPLQTIKEKYLKDVLVKARNILRKGTMECSMMVVSDEVPDSYLDDLLAYRWRGNLVLWAMRWDPNFNKGDKETATEEEGAKE